MIGLVVLALAVFGATRLYASMQTGDDVAAPAVGTEAPVTAADVDELDGEYTVTEGSEAGYRVDEVLAGEDVTVVGRTDQVTGSATIAGGELADATVEVDMASIETDETARDGQFRSILDAATHPTATFELASPVDVSAVADGETVTVEAPGTMTIKGTSQDVTATLQVRLTEAGAEVSAQIPVVFTDYGVNAPKLGFVTVEDEGFVEAQLQLTR
ncbi:YceI family protein [Antribacter gilvus]|uniref:YceI family protein n=1 Tax=Antribacter gilvus TaxID=2304675 RepID=UPI000F78D45B|nr:YceI family protein [Antribacter gilvus]